MIFNRFKATFFLMLFIASLFGIVDSIQQVKANQGSAGVYILQLDGVGSWVAGEARDPEQICQGVIDATTPLGKYTHIPRAHPTFEKNPPYFCAGYQVIRTWDDYLYIGFLQIPGVIVINTHGEILPIPSYFGYTKEQWVNMIAEKMISQRMTWVNVGGSPFYYVWYYGATEKTLWGPAGFQTLMSNIGLGSVEIPTTLPVMYAELTGEAGQFLRDRAWEKFFYASHVDLARPLKKSDFANYTVLPLYRRPYDSEEYWEGAIIAFVKAGSRITATNGFGSFVHLGTSQTYDALEVPTNRDYYAGYVTAAAAIWAESLQFEPQSASMTRRYAEGYGGSELHVAPTMAGYWWETGGTFQVRVYLAIYGALMSPSRTPDWADYVIIQVGGIPSTFQIKANLDASRYGTKTELKIKGFENPVASQDGKLIGYFAAGAKFLLGFTPIGPVVSGAIFFSEWLRVPARSTDSGVNEYASNVHFSYYPESSWYDQGSFRYEEFQTLIALDFKVPVESKGDWVVVPFEISARLITAKSELTVEVDMGRSMAMWFDPYNHVILFSEDFEHDIAGWNAGDENGLSGNDYWGIVGSDISGKPSQAAWCAQTGENSITGQPNQQSRKYDKSMDAYLTRELDLRPFQYAELSYDLFTYYARPGDYLVVEYYPRTGGTWIELKGPYGQDPSHYTWFSDNAVIPNSATRIRFRFHSNDDDDVDLGPSIDNVHLKGVLHNDASTMSDAGDLNEMSKAASISVSSSILNYAGYLDPSQPDNHDWYKFLASGNKVIYASLNAPPGYDFDIKLYDPDGNNLAGPSDTISYWIPYHFPISYWYVDIYLVTGFGQYSFDIKVSISSDDGGGGGCPYISAWNGTQYALDNNVIPAAEGSNGTDVVDYCMLQKPLIRDYGKYSLLIWDLDKHSFLDKIEFMAVDHEPDINVAVSPNGDILTYKTPTTPLRVLNSAGQDVTAILGAVDENYYEGYAGDYLLFNFGNLDVSKGAKLVMRTDLLCEPKPCEESIHIQVLNAGGEWVDVASFIPRVYWATDIIDLSGHLPEVNGDIRVRLYFTANHKIDYAGLDTTKQGEFRLTYGNLAAANHTRLGDVKQLFQNTDDQYVELLPGEQVALRFTLPQNFEEERDFIIILEGHYFTIG